MKSGEKGTPKNPLRGKDGQTFGERLTALMRSRGMTQTELADRMKVGKSTVNQWMSDTSEPTARAVLWLADYFNTEVRYLLTGQYSKLPNNNNNDDVPPLVTMRKPRSA